MDFWIMFKTVLVPSFQHSMFVPIIQIYWLICASLPPKAFDVDGPVLDTFEVATANACFVRRWYDSEELLLWYLNSALQYLHTTMLSDLNENFPSINSRLSGLVGSIEYGT